VQELESALGKQAEPGTLSPTTSKSSSLAPTVAAGQLRNESPPAEPPARQLTVRFSDEVETSGDAGRQTIRPQKPSDGLSVVDQAWGLLFDSNDEPTARLEEVLRGLANYIVCRRIPSTSKSQSRADLDSARPSSSYQDVAWSLPLRSSPPSIPTGPRANTPLIMQVRTPPVR